MKFRCVSKYVTTIRCLWQAGKLQFGEKQTNWPDSEILNLCTAKMLNLKVLRKHGSIVILWQQNCTNGFCANSFMLHSKGQICRQPWGLSVCVHGVMTSNCSVTGLAVWAHGAQPSGKVKSPGSRREVKVSSDAKRSVRVRTQRFTWLMGM